MKINQRFWALLFGILTLISCSWSQALTLEPYQQGDWSKIQKVYKGKIWIVHFWGITCGPCIVELPRWGDFMKKNPNLAVVFVEVDQAPEKVVRHYIENAAISQATQRISTSSFDEYFRYEIDPKWMGELPATYLILSDGQRIRIENDDPFKQLKQLLKPL